MWLYQIVVSEMQCNCRLEVFQFLAEGQCQTGETAHVQPRGCVQSLNITRGHKVHVRRTCDGSFVYGNERRRTVFVFGMLRVIVLVCLYDLAKINVCTEGLLDSVNVGSQRITGNLHAIGKPSVQVGYESLCRG